jgi:hypothetical protein
MRRPLTAAVCVCLLVAGCSSGSNSGGSPATTTDAATTSSTSSSAPASTSTTTTATPTRTALATTSTAHTEPWNDKDADFGFVSNATAVDGGVTFTFDRATWLLAKDIPAWNKANPGHPVTEADDYAIGNISTKKRTFLLRTGAKIFGSVILSDQPEPKRITAAQFVSRVNSAGEPVTCWIYHQYGGLTGDVVQLEEQYRP